MMDSNHPILVTGAAGFIGFHTAKHLLAAGRKVVGVDNLNDYYDVNLKQARLDQLLEHPNFSFTKLNIADRPAMEKCWQDHGGFYEVIHLAAQAGVRYSLTNPFAYVESNIQGQMVLLELCRHQADFKQLVYASSSSVYGANTKLPFSIHDAVDHPVSLYAATKRSCELLTESYSRLYNITATGLRFFTVYGPWGRPDMAMFIFTKAILEGQPIDVYNNGDMRRDFTYIDDIVSGVVACLDHPSQNAPPHQIFNLGNNNSEPLPKLIQTIEQAVGKKAITQNKPMQPGDVQDTYADIKASQDILSFSPKTNISEGVPKFVDWYRGFYEI